MHRFLRNTISVRHKIKNSKVKPKCFAVVNPFTQISYRNVYTISNEEVEKSLKDHELQKVDQRFRSYISLVTEKKINAHKFLRAIMEHDSWYIPVNKDFRTFQNRFRDEQSRIYQFYYTDLQAMINGDNYILYRDSDKLPENRYFLTLPGYKIFQTMDENIDFISINPQSPPFEIHYKNHQIPLLKQWATTVYMEKMIADSAGVSKEFLKLLKFYEHYWIVLNKRTSDEGYDIALAPDVNFHYLAAIFTAEDRVDEFLERRKEELGEKCPEDVKYKTNGTELFTQLLSMRPEGIVFNCMHEAKAFTIEFVEEILGVE